VLFVVSRFAAHAEREQQFSLGRVLLNDVMAEVRDPDVSFVIDAKLVRIAEHAAAPGAHELAVGRVNLHRIRPLAKEPDLVLVVDGQPGDPTFAGNVIGPLRPIGIDVVFDQVRLDGKARRVGRAGRADHQQQQAATGDKET